MARENAGLGPDLGDGAVPQSALADRELEHLGRRRRCGGEHEGEREHVARMEPRAARRNPGIPHSASLHARYPTLYFSIICASSSRPKPGPVATCIMPS